ncbi:hypothetical protein ABZ759_32095 [Streptomyces sp. NPDC047860]|uniref:hypothetical protein n=1 Tax=Streptomyces sp. NPDC047860 TaxID=3155743 RepID=UPI0033F624B8
MGPLQWGDVPTWIGGTGALAAAWYAYQTISSQRQQISEQQQFIAEQTRFMNEQRQNLELERAELRAVADDRRWAQARQIAMHQRRIGSDNDGHGWVVTVQNPSDASVRDVEVYFGTAYRAVRAFEWPPFDHYPQNPTDRGADPLPIPVPTLGSRRAARFVSQRWTAATAHDNRPTLYFTDDDGVRWWLDSHGKLEEALADSGP